VGEKVRIDIEEQVEGKSRRTVLREEDDRAILGQARYEDEDRSLVGKMRKETAVM